MAIKLNKEESLFRNELIFTPDAKAVNIDNVLVNLFMLLKHNGIRPRQRARSDENSLIKLSTLNNVDLYNSIFDCSVPSYPYLE